MGFDEENGTNLKDYLKQEEKKTPVPVKCINKILDKNLKATLLQEEYKIRPRQEQNRD